MVFCLVKPHSSFIRQSYPTAQMTLLHHLPLCRLHSLDFLAQAPLSVCSLIYFITSLPSIPGSFITSLLLLHPASCFVTPLHFQIHHTFTLPQCVTSLSKNTQYADVSTTSTVSTCARHTAKKVIRYKREQFSWAMLAKDILLLTRHNKHRIRETDTQTLAMARQVIAHTPTLLAGTEDETYCLR
jgi:hypothetical protein